jgi:hypothetical protein
MPTPGNAWRDIVLKVPPGLTVPITAPEQLPFGMGTIYVQTGSYPAAPLFDGEQVFGDPASFSVGQLDGKPSSVDGWLGLTPGTTVYGAGHGRHWGVAGKFLGQSMIAVNTDFASLVGMAGFEAPFVFPTNETISFNAWQMRRNCRMVSTEIVADTNGPQGGGSNWSLLFWCVVRDNGTV